MQNVSIGMSRRSLFAAGSVTLAGVASLEQAGVALASTGSSNESVVRAWYKAWEAKDWAQASAVSTDDFTFTSPAGDNHISKATFKKNCWDTQIAFIKAMDLELVMAQGDDVLVKYTCRTTNGKTFTNVEHFRLRDHRIASLQCFFGGKMTYPSSVSRQ